MEAVILAKLSNASYLDILKLTKAERIILLEMFRLLSTDEKTKAEIENE